MADELDTNPDTEQPADPPTGGAAEGSRDEAAGNEAPRDQLPSDEASSADPPDDDPTADFKQGLALLWKAAVGTATEIKKEVDKGGVGDALKDAGRELEVAANAAARTIEGFVDRVAASTPRASTPKYEEGWPPKGSPPEGSSDGSAEDRAKKNEPADGGVDGKGERRDMRIQIDDD